MSTAPSRKSSPLAFTTALPTSVVHRPEPLLSSLNRSCPRSAAASVAEAIASMRGQVRPTLLCLQLLLLVAVGISGWQAPQTGLSKAAFWFPLLGILAMSGTLLCVPLRVITATWFPGLLAVVDTVITALLFYSSKQTGLEAYLAYFLILVMAFVVPTRRHVVVYAGIITVLYGLALYRDGLGWLASNSHLVQLPIILAAAVGCGLAMESLNVFAHTDALTGLPTRKSFLQAVRGALREARRANQRFAILIIESSDVLKSVGGKPSTSSDEVLNSMVAKLVPLLHPGDMLARHGRSSFAILKKSRTNVVDVAYFAHDVIDRLQVPLIHGGHTHHLTSHIGTEVIAGSYRDGAATAVDKARAALAKAQSRGKNCFEFFAQDLDTRAFDPVFLEVSLRKALDRGQLSISYQPKIDLLSEALTGTEALMRWQHPDLGAFSPTVFIPLAERCGLIDELGEWILRRACIQWKQWQRSGLPPSRLAVNLSPKQLQNRNVVSMVSRILRESQLEPQYLELEITETLLVGESEESLATLHDLHSLGVRLSVDDFGTGYSGLTYLTHLPVHALKIDRRFVQEISKGFQAEAVLKGIINMASQMGLNTIAEGVETMEQAIFLRTIGCQEAQGFYYSQPLACQEMQAYLQNEQRRQVIEMTKNSLIAALTSRYGGGGPGGSMDQENHP